jgi:hypothetical protein
MKYCKGRNNYKTKTTDPQSSHSRQNTRPTPKHKETTGNNSTTRNVKLKNTKRDDNIATVKNSTPETQNPTRRKKNDILHHRIISTQNPSVKKHSCIYKTPKEPKINTPTERAKLV